MLFTIPVALATALTLFPASHAPAYQEYVALGDSWSADVSLTHMTTEHTPRGCLQATYNYPKQVAAALRVATFRDATCSGATTTAMREPQRVRLVPRLIEGVNKPQFDRLTRRTDLVTLGIGGNDAGLSHAVLGCINLLPSLAAVPGLALPAPLGKPCSRKWVTDGADRMSRNIRATEPKVAAAVRGVRERSPRARILLVNYLAGLPENGGCWPYVTVTDEDMRWLSARLRELNAMLGRVAAAEQVELVDTYSTSLGHDVCKPAGTRWVEALLPISTNPPGPAVPFHPNRLGANHQASSVLDALSPR